MNFPGKVLVLLFCLTIVVSCEDELNKYPFVSVSPSELTIEATSGEYISFDIKTSSDYTLDKFIISEKKIGSNETAIIDSNIKYKSFNYTFDYLYPIDYTEDEITLSFKAININGDMFTAKRLIILNEGTLQEFSGMKMYTKQSGKECAFNISSLESISGNSDSTLVDIIDAPTDDISESPMLKWVSYSGASFVTFNGFDYAVATLNSIKNAFDSGEQKTELTELQEEDIILIKTNESKYSAIKITRIMDNAGVSDDFYEFNIKAGSTTTP